MSEGRIRTHYDNLQVSRTASDEVIRGAWRYLCQKYHPDKYTGDRAHAERITKTINEAYDVLSDPDKRRAHDEWIAREELRQAGEDNSHDEAKAATEDTDQGARIALSPAVRDEYVRSIGRGGIALFVLLGVVAGVLNLFIWALIPPIGRFMERHDWAPILLFIVTAWTIGKESYDKRLKRVAAFDDDRLEVVYRDSSQRKMVAIIASSVLVVGVMIVIAIRMNHQAGAPKPTEVPATATPPPAAPVEAAPHDAPAAPVAAASPASSSAEPATRVLEDNPTLVAKGDAYLYGFSTSGTLKIKLVVTVDGDMPVDVLTVPQTSKSEYMTIANQLQVGDALTDVAGLASLFGVSSDEDRKYASERDEAVEGVFRTGLAKRGVYRRYESGWVNLKKGSYDIVIDNTDAFTVAKADAPVQIRLYAEAADHE